MRNTLSEAEIKATLEALKQAEGNQTKVAKALGLARSTVQYHLAQAACRGFLGTEPVLPGYAIKKISSQLDSDGELEREWIQQSKLGEEFILADQHTIKGISALVDPSGKIIQQWIKTKLEPHLADVTAAIKKAFEEYSGKAKLPLKIPVVNDELATIYPIADHHLGMYSWKEETGDDYDLAIGERLLKETMAELVSLSQSSDTAIILNLGDFFHSDNNENRTRRGGNALDVDTRYAKVLQAGVDLMIHAVQLALTKHHKVIVRNLQGNHDPYAALALAIAMASYFSGHDRVTIDTDPSPFFFWKFGKVLVGATHGDMAKPDAMAQIMAAKRAKEWGETEYRYIYLGHVHKKNLGGGDLAGATWETFQTLAPKDAWSTSMGFTSGRSMQSITHHKDRGEVTRLTVAIKGPA